VRLTREHLPGVHGGAFDNPRVQLVIGDAADYVAHAPGAAFDLAVFDLTPPDSPAAGLYTRDFLMRLKRILRPDAVISVHLGSPDYHAERVAGLLDELRAAFRIVRTMSAFIPLYGSLWMMATASDTLDPAALTADALANRLAAREIGTLRHYAPDTHVGLFSTTPSVRDKLSQFLKL
jgi:spermidine synthase